MAITPPSSRASALRARKRSGLSNHCRADDDTTADRPYGNGISSASPARKTALSGSKSASRLR
jgi:hypothetical protein